MKKYMLPVLILVPLCSFGNSNPVYPRNAYDWNNDIYGFVKNKHYVTAGFGFVNLTAPLANKIMHQIGPQWDNIAFSNAVVYYAKVERAITKRSGLAFGFARGGFNMLADKDSLTSMNLKVKGKLVYRTTSYLARYNFHFFPEKRFDLYTGIGIGYRWNRFALSDNDPERNYWDVPVKVANMQKYIPTTYGFGTWGGEITVGMRYHILPPIAVYFETGFAKSLFQAGATIRF